jgi:hypothetical protein
MRLSAITAAPAPGAAETAMPGSHAPSTLPVAATSRRQSAVGAHSTTLPVTAVSASTPMPMPAGSSGSAPAGRKGTRLRTMLPCTTAKRPPALKLVTAAPTAAPSTMSLAISASSKPNSAWSATSPTPRQVSPRIWRFDAALPRTAEKAAPLIGLPRTIMLPARKTVMALPFWPAPPARAAVSSIRLSMISVPSSPGPDRQKKMPPLPAPRTQGPGHRSRK